MADDYAKWLDLGKRLGHEGNELEQYVQKQIDDCEAREQRRQKFELAREQEQEQIRIREQEREEQLRIREHERELELLRAKSELGTTTSVSVTPDSNQRTRPKLLTTVTTISMRISNVLNVLRKVLAGAKVHGL